MRVKFESSGGIGSLKGTSPSTTRRFFLTGKTVIIPAPPQPLKWSSSTGMNPDGFTSGSVETEDDDGNLRVIRVPRARILGKTK
ncbi:hypothetical protein J6590_090917 [Homalodisca vitripennis]|nr:hypothetical protein J6590_090917 [Homalodisca vitripennis]